MTKLLFLFIVRKKYIYDFLLLILIDAAAIYNSNNISENIFIVASSLLFILYTIYYHFLNHHKKRILFFYRGKSKIYIKKDTIKGIVKLCSFFGIIVSALDFIFLRSYYIPLTYFITLFVFVISVSSITINIEKSNTKTQRTITGKELSKSVLISIIIYTIIESFLQFV